MLLVLPLLKKSLMWPLNHWMWIYRCAHENGNIIYCSVDLEKWGDHVIKVSCIQQIGHQRRGLRGGAVHPGTGTDSSWICANELAPSHQFFPPVVSVVQSTGTNQLCCCDAWHCCRQPRTFALLLPAATSARMMINYIRMHFFFLCRFSTSTSAGSCHSPQRTSFGSFLCVFCLLTSIAWVFFLLIKFKIEKSNSSEVAITPTSQHFFQFQSTS